MPNPRIVSEFVDMVTAGQFVEAIERFYSADARVQENCNPPRIGRQAIVEHELATLSSFDSIRAQILDTPLINGDRVVIHWRIEFDHPAGGTMSLDELTDQTWKDDKLVSERFFYDPGQMAITRQAAQVRH